MGFPYGSTHDSAVQSSLHRDLCRASLGGSTLYPPTLTTAASRTAHDVLLERATIHAITLAPAVLAGYRRAGLGGEDRWLAAALDESACG